MRDPDISTSPLSPAPGLASRARAFGKAALYLVVAFLSALLVSALLKAMTGRTLQALLQSGPLDALTAHAALLVSLVLLPTALSLAVFREPFAWSGWSARRASQFALIGLATGAGLMSAIVGVLWALGAWSPSAAPMTLAQAVGLLGISALLWVVQAAHEEGLHRGYAFVQLSRALSFWPATALLSLWFVAGHLGQPGASPVSLAVAGLFALSLAWSFLRTGSLWFALGVHASWNFVQSSVFGLANSGGESRHAVLTSTLNGPDLLTGGAAGPEGSLLSLAAIVGLLAIIAFVLPRPGREDLPSAAERSR